MQYLWSGGGGGGGGGARFHNGPPDTQLSGAISHIVV